MQNQISVHPFSANKLIELIRGTAADIGSIPAQVEYLSKYCESLKAKTIVHERHYMDRHYVDEYAFYYSRVLKAPKNCVERIHFFTREFTESEFSGWLEKGLESVKERKDVEEELEKSYLGFSVIRPIASAPIGRTIVARLPDGDVTRQIWATNRHIAHIANLRLHIDGLAFQQQDAAVGACATAALWSAMVRVARHDGMRAPTPAEISDVATSTIRSGSRPMLTASTGLTVQQLCQATRALGFAPEVISASEKPEIFMIAMHTYLQSGIPVVLALRGGGSGHAITASGFQISSSENPSLHTTFKVKSAGLRKFYVHDDRIGPYARAYIDPFPHHPDIGDGLIFEIQWKDITENMLVDCGIAPIYPKLRLPVRSLVALAEYLSGPIEHLVGIETASKLRVDFRYERSGEYLSKLSGRVHDKKKAAALVRTVVLSRWCAVIRWFIDDQEQIEFVYDTTDVVRDVAIQNRELLRAIVCLDPAIADIGIKLAQYLNVPFS